MASVNPIRERHSERGAELIEFALILPLLIFIILGLIDFGFMFQRFEVVTPRTPP
jgi:Flp pilus assembly protein TadG